MSKIYTCTGDKGTTSLVGGQRVSKDNPRLEAYGTIDELNSFIGVVASKIADKTEIETPENIRWIQGMVFNIGGLLATDTTTTKLPESCYVKKDDISKLEKMIDLAQESLPVQRTFILPGGTEAASFSHVARTVCRRAERLIVTLQSSVELPEEIIVFINRLSDYLFVLARRINYFSGTEEISW